MDKPESTLRAQKYIKDETQGAVKNTRDLPWGNTYGKFGHREIPDDVVILTRETTVTIRNHNVSHKEQKYYSFKSSAKKTTFVLNDSTVRDVAPGSYRKRRAKDPWNKASKHGAGDVIEACAAHKQARHTGFQRWVGPT